MNLAHGQVPRPELGDEVIERIFVFGEQQQSQVGIGEDALLGQLCLQSAELDLKTAVFYALGVVNQFGDFFEFVLQVGFSASERGAFQFALPGLALGVVHFIPFFFGRDVGHREVTKLVRGFQELLQSFLAADEGLLERVRGTGHPALIHRHDETDRTGAAFVTGFGGTGGLALNVMGDGLVKLHFRAFKTERNRVGDALLEQLDRLPGAVRLRLREIEHHFFGAPEVAGGFPAIHRVVDRLHVRVGFLVEQLKEQAEVGRVALVRRGRQQKKVGGLLAEQFAEAIPLALVLGVPRRHAMGLVHDYQVPVIRLPDTGQDLLPLRQVHRRDDLGLVVPEVDAVLDAEIAAAQDVEGLLETIGQFTLPLEGEVGRADDEHALDQATKLQFLEQQTRHDRFSRTSVVSQEKPAPGGLEKVIVNSVELMRQGIDPRDGETEVGVVFLGQRDADGFEAELEQARLALEDGFLALDLDGCQVLVRERHAAPERVGARADQVDQDEAVAGRGRADDAHRLAKLRTNQDDTVDDVVGRNAHWWQLIAYHRSPDWGHNARAAELWPSYSAQL